MLDPPDLLPHARCKREIPCLQTAGCLPHMMVEKVHKEETPRSRVRLHSCANRQMKRAVIMVVAVSVLLVAVSISVREVVVEVVVCIEALVIGVASVCRWYVG